MNQNRSCHLRDRDINFRAALSVFGELSHDLDLKIGIPAGKEEIRAIVDKLQKNLKNAIYHASMAELGRKKLEHRSEGGVEDKVIADFLLTFNASCNTIKYLISHSLLVQKLDEGDAKQSQTVKIYIQKMKTLDEESITKFVEQLKTRLYLFNQTMKIQE